MTTLTLPGNLQNLIEQLLRQQLPTAIELDPNVLAYRWQTKVNGSGELVPLTVASTLSLDDLIGIDTQKAKLVQNTHQYLAGLPANHVLMTGTRGAGKSSLIRALLNTFANDGLRIIEVNRDDLIMLEPIRQAIRELNERVPNHGCYYVHPSGAMLLGLQGELGQLDLIDAPGVTPAIDKEVHVLQDVWQFDGHYRISSR